MKTLNLKDAQHAIHTAIQVALGSDSNDKESQLLGDFLDSAISLLTETQTIALARAMAKDVNAALPHGPCDLQADDVETLQSLIASP